MSAILAIDPGTEQSALVVYDPIAERVLLTQLSPNANIEFRLRYAPFKSPCLCVIERIAGMGMAVGETTFETVFWSGRFAATWDNARSTNCYRVFRRDVKLHLCGTMQAKDSNVRQALIDRFGPSKEIAIGKKRTPGPLYGIHSHSWAALAVAVTFADTQIAAYSRARQQEAAHEHARR